MIQINLLPAELRVKHQNPNQGTYLRIAVGVGVFISLLTLYFYADFWIVSGKINGLDGKWKQVQPQSLELNALKTEVEGPLKQEREFLQQFVTTQKPVTYLMAWANKLLPEGAWLDEMSLKRDSGKVNFVLHGSCMNTKSRTSIEQIEIYLQGFKEKMPDARLTLKTARMDIAQTELTQFTAKFSWSETSGASGT
ncbi:MAG: CDP-alcohol phosphatidyltransferase family protein [Candidatus Omnitrophica bacterium]|nr:CDP-alcohol phosphatidyltransferase family protein [Candidatus Omnitrophota bacterium]